MCKLSGCKIDNEMLGDGVKEPGLRHGNSACGSSLIAYLKDPRPGAATCG
jgi:hypothetical protein